MIPEHKISSTPVVKDYFYEKPNTKLIDRTLGGIALQNTSEGLEYQLWEIYYDSPEIKLKALTTGQILVLDSIPKVTEVSVAFDLNMNVSYAYVSNGLAYLKFYDTTIQNFTTKLLEHGKSPRLVYDDLREMQTQLSDIVCAYINTETLHLCYRLLRDRYTLEYPLHPVEENARLIRVGMSEGLRLQFKMQLV